MTTPTPVLYANQSAPPMIVAISGASGLIGSAVASRLEQQGHEVRRLVRRDARTANEISWNPSAGSIDQSRLAGVDAVVHLAGESLAQRWTDDVKRRLRDSRVQGTALIARSLAALPIKPRVLVSGSAIGIYGSHRDEPVDEDSTLGDDFLAMLGRDWETAAAPAADAGIRVVNLRTGLVLSQGGGLLQKLLIPFRAGLGGKLGSGRQWMSWISLTDTVEAITFLLGAEAPAGPVNMVAPNPVTNEEFTDVLAKVLHRPALFSVPRFAMRALMGEMADETALASQRVRPRRLLAAGFPFVHPALETALRAELAATSPALR